MKVALSNYVYFSPVERMPWIHELEKYKKYEGLLAAVSIGQIWFYFYRNRLVGVYNNKQYQFFTELKKSGVESDWMTLILADVGLGEDIEIIHVKDIQRVAFDMIAKQAASHMLDLLKDGITENENLPF